MITQMSVCVDLEKVNGPSQWNVAVVISDTTILL